MLRRSLEYISVAFADVLAGDNAPDIDNKSKRCGERTQTHGGRVYSVQILEPELWVSSVVRTAPYCARNLDMTSVSVECCYVALPHD